jgi:DNA/RNA-binding domain of Phe-tRNA-synthetase-like protein
MLTVDPHPLLDLHSFTARFPRPLSEMPSPATLLDLLRPDAAGPMQADDSVRESVRALLRHGGFKPTGRSKPASEYLIKAVREGFLSSINLAVDACNVVSLHSGLPISVVDSDRLQGNDTSLRVGITPPDSSYVFNAAGQSIDLGGLLCLFDAEGPCANAVKDAQRTKTSPETTRVHVLIWGTTALPERGSHAARWYREMLEQAGAAIVPVFP